MFCWWSHSFLSWKCKFSEYSKVLPWAVLTSIWAAYKYCKKYVLSLSGSKWPSWNCHILSWVSIGLFSSQIPWSPFNYHQTQPLLEKIKNIITSWTNNFLSYSGRLQLIISVIHAIHSYWSAHFILPAAVLKDIKSSMSRFLWKGPSMQKFGAKVAWNKISLPTAEGGLAIKNLEDWNRASILMHSWHIINPSSSSFWAKWVKTFQLRNKFFWCIPIPNDCDVSLSLETPLTTLDIVILLFLILFSGMA